MLFLSSSFTLMVTTGPSAHFLTVTTRSPTVPSLYVFIVANKQILNVVDVNCSCRNDEVIEP